MTITDYEVVFIDNKENEELVKACAFKKIKEQDWPKAIFRSRYTSYPFLHELAICGVLYDNWAQEFIEVEYRIAEGTEGQEGTFATCHIEGVTTKRVPINLDKPIFG